LIYIAVGTVALSPGTVLSVAGAVQFGPYEGTLYTWIGATIGATLAYWMARVLGRDFVERRFGGRFAAFDQRIREHGFTGLLIIRLLPLFPFNAVNFGSGLTGIRLRDGAVRKTLRGRTRGYTGCSLTFVTARGFPSGSRETQSGQ
jgi:uncharacterized membrane protein YdjX (TVP38/TMEM64 family)